eukprot:CAMPEP_0197325254 /NCGR_PEP_ID=MMETSP0892-20130614/159_1 /TAXON_ID=44058 ORGANISM="Aureoumbra lagunensis, Strain CCMP1510" /NCGR_SAMPLE_ID=MMETSP0892 /ASSEMBLY_ACC=CAM_ASM_000538 /LENGTH=230 /DNA_ID=CAMNT_0042818263 /DNA_START=29 /DNA_END=721 /DNA_ORIENTATION=+
MTDFCYTSYQAYNNCGKEFHPLSHSPLSHSAKKKGACIRELKLKRKDYFHPPPPLVAKKVSTKPKLNMSDTFYAHVALEYHDEEDPIVAEVGSEVMATDVIGINTVNDLSTTDLDEDESWCDVDYDWESVSVASSAVSEPWTDLKTSWKDIVLKNSDKPAPKPTTKISPFVPRVRKPPPILESCILDDDGDIYEPIGQAEIDYARRTRKSKQACASRLRRLTQKAKVRGD